MDVERVFHMKQGVGDSTYSKNSSLQKKASEMMKDATLEAVKQVWLTLRPDSLGMADLGCSSGPNSLSIIKDMIIAIACVETTLVNHNSQSQNHQVVMLRELRVYLNDLPSNDFNSIFKTLPDFRRDLIITANTTTNLYLAAYPGSFYNRLFPDQSLHFVYSSYSLHWLSKIPRDVYDKDGINSINKGCIYISKSSPPSVAQAYELQFREDFTSFLHLRSEEVVPGGQMVLIFLGRQGVSHIDRGNSFLWDLLARSFSSLILNGKVEKEKVDSYEVNFYAACKEEIEDGITREGSFEMTRFKMFELERREMNGLSYGEAVAATVRAIQEPLITKHFGDGILLDTLFQHYARLINHEMAIQDITPVTFLLVLKKKNNR